MEEAAQSENVDAQEIEGEKEKIDAEEKRNGRTARFFTTNTEYYILHTVKCAGGEIVNTLP